MVGIQALLKQGELDERAVRHRTHGARTPRELERWHAKASMRNADLIVELVLRAADDMRAFAQGVVHAAISLASGIKATLAKPVKH